MKKIMSCIFIIVFTLGVLMSCSKEVYGDFDDPIGDYDKTDTVEIENDGHFLVKSKTYDYNEFCEGNATILYVESDNDKNYTIEITGYYYDKEGDLLLSEEKKFYGFASGFYNYFVFYPYMKYDMFEYQLDVSAYEGEPLSQYIERGRCYPDVVIDFNTGGLYKCAGIGGWFEFWNTCSEKRMMYSAVFVMFDNKGEIYVIDDRLICDGLPALDEDNSNTYKHQRNFYGTSTPWEARHKVKLPLALMGGKARGLVAIRHLADSAQDPYFKEIPYSKIPKEENNWQYPKKPPK